MKTIATAPKNLLYFTLMVGSITTMPSVVVALKGASISTATVNTAASLTATTTRDLLQQPQEQDESSSSTVERKLQDCVHQRDGKYTISLTVTVLND
jgi:hypothetical protein